MRQLRLFFSGYRLYTFEVEFENDRPSERYMRLMRRRVLVSYLGTRKYDEEIKGMKRRISIVNSEKVTGYEYRSLVVIINTMKV